MNATRESLDGQMPEIVARFGADTRLGRRVRRLDARTHLRVMADVESTVLRQQHLNQQITDRIARMHAEHQLQMSYLMEFGVLVEERQILNRVLAEVAEHGLLTLREAARATHEIGQRALYSSNAAGADPGGVLN
ncbi:MAG: hypothetical protein R3C59_30965 [Planctomycetaceae bacterium]